MAYQKLTTDVKELRKWCRYYEYRMLSAQSETASLESKCKSLESRIVELMNECETHKERIGELDRILNELYEHGQNIRQ